jgi:very-short-patch-repair endonuclease
MSKIINRDKYKKFRRDLRNNMPEPEKVLWYHLRRKQFMGIKFRRQCSIGKYIVDFYSFDKKIVIEIDGDSHAKQEEYDQRRENYLESLGLKIIRFNNRDIMNNLESCLNQLATLIKTE